MVHDRCGACVRTLVPLVVVLGCVGRAQAEPPCAPDCAEPESSHPELVVIEDTRGAALPTGEGGVYAGGALPPISSFVSSPDEPRFALYADPLGVLQLGATVGAEYGRSWAGHLRLRIPMSLDIGNFRRGADYRITRDLTSGFAGGLGLRYYFGGEGLRGFYVGGGAELEYAVWDVYDYRVEGSSLSWDEYSGDSLHLMLKVEVGYRWVWGSFLLGVGGSFGRGVVLDQSRAAATDYFFTTLNVELGFAL